MSAPASTKSLGVYVLDEQKVADHLRRGTRFPGVSLDADGEVPCAIRGSVVSSNGNLVSKIFVACVRILWDGPATPVLRPEKVDSLDAVSSLRWVTIHEVVEKTLFDVVVDDALYRWFREYHHVRNSPQTGR